MASVGGDLESRRVGLSEHCLAQPTAKAGADRWFGSRSAWLDLPDELLTIVSWICNNHSAKGCRGWHPCLHRLEQRGQQ